MFRVALLVLATFLSYAVAWLIGRPAFVPILNVLPAWLCLYSALRARRPARAVGEMLAWAAALAISATVISYVDPAGTDRLFVHGEAYRREMFTWVRTGVGAESDPAQFVPTQMLHAAVFSVLSLVSGSLLSMPMGAVLMNYMGHYVGALAAVSAHPLLTALAAWVPWALVRIASFVVLGVVFAGPVASRVLGYPSRLRDHRHLLLVAVAGLVADVLLKSALAPRWHTLLAHLVGWR